jgi:hypothetical protein
VIDPEAQAGDEYHGPASVAVRQDAHHGHRHELHQRPRRAEGAENFRSAGRVAFREPLHELGQHRDHDPQREHVEQDRDEDEGERGAPEAHLPLSIPTGNSKKKSFTAKDARAAKEDRSLTAKDAKKSTGKPTSKNAKTTPRWQEAALVVGDTKCRRRYDQYTFSNSILGVVLATFGENC